jgi:hypothetical protein
MVILGLGYSGNKLRLLTSDGLNQFLPSYYLFAQSQIIKIRS